jgi:prevent-host-death family protein
MKHMQVREAKARFSEAVDTAANGEPVTITRHGTPVAMLVPIEKGEQMYPEQKPEKSLIDLLMEYPGGDDLDLERDRRPMRDIDL